MHDDLFFKYYLTQLRSSVPIGTVVIDDIYMNPNEQEKEMEIANMKVFEYCIINFNENGSPYISVGPAIVVTLGEENPRDAALLRIGRRHAGIINDESEVQIRPFC